MRTFDKQQRDAIALSALNKVLAQPEREFGYRHVSAENRINMDTAKKYVRRWLNDGIVIAVTEGKGSSFKLFKRAPDYRPQPVAKARNGLMNMWSTMRGLKTFSAVDLAAHATTDTVTVTVKEAQAYADALHAADYLRIERKAIEGKQDAIYRLVRNTGVTPPMVRDVPAVIDLNTGATIVLRGAA